MEMFLIRTAQSVLNPMTDKATARRLAEQIARFALDNWEEMVRRYDTTDCFTLMEKLTREVIDEGCLEAA